MKVGLLLFFELLISIHDVLGVGFIEDMRKLFGSGLNYGMSH